MKGKRHRRGRDEGSVFRRQDGLWVAEVNLGVVDGKRRRKQLYGATRSAVMARLKDCLLAQHQGIPLNFDHQTVGEYLDAWLKDAAAPRLRPRTFVGYSQTVNTHLKPVLGHIELRALMPQHIQSLIGSKVTEGLSPRTIRGIRAVLRSALSDAVKWRTLTYDAAKAVSLPRAQRVETRVLTPEQARAFVAVAEENRLGPLFLVALAVGLRLGEALGLRWKDVNLERRDLHVRQALQRVDKELRFVEPKSEQSRRTIAIPEFAAAVLKRHRTTQLEERLKAGSRWTDSGLVFTSTIGTPLDERNVRRAFTAILKGANLPRIRIHDLRHTCASLLLVQGVHPRVVMETLGHSQISLTMETYSHVLPALQHEAARQIDTLLNTRVRL